MRKNRIARWRRDFFAGLAVILPAAVSIAIVLLLFRTVSRNFTDTLLFFLPRTLTHAHEGSGPIHWYWSVVALLWAVLLVTLVGAMARHYVVKKIIAFFERVFLRVPLLNKIYLTIKQVNDAFSSSGKSSFKQVVLVQFPRVGHYSVGFLTGEQNEEVQARTQKKVVSVFVPTTPNPTSGYLVLVPEDEVVHLKMSVADGIRFIISLGSVAPPYPSSLPDAAIPKVLSDPPPQPAQLSG
ncbi:MAG: DUF502 domain-containing protein [Verrucomicrobia bacterium]|nr:DUF502 domain-containing protein [Verrucomicrobiota bacterium]